MKGFLGAIASGFKAVLGMGDTSRAPVAAARHLALPSVERRKVRPRHRRQLLVWPVGSKLEKRFAEACERGPRGY